MLITGLAGPGNPEPFGHVAATKEQVAKGLGTIEQTSTGTIPGS